MIWWAFSDGQGGLGLWRSLGKARLDAGASSMEFCESESSEEKLLWLEIWKYWADSARGPAGAAGVLGSEVVPWDTAEGRGGSAPGKRVQGGRVKGRLRAGWLRSWPRCPAALRLPLLLALGWGVSAEIWC